MELLLWTSLEVKEHYESLDNKKKQELYSEILKEAKDAIESNNISHLKKLSEIAVVIEEVSEKELLESFNDKNPLREATVVVERGGSSNYLFSLSDSSKLYDSRENEEEAIYQAIKSNDIELVKHVLIVLLSSDFEEKVDPKGLVELLSKGYEELNLSKDMKNYLERKIRFCSFLCDCKFDKDPIELFANRSEVDYEIDKFLLSMITKKTKGEELLFQINSMIELLKKYEKFDELEYKIRRLKSELEHGKSRYPAEMIQGSIEEREKEMREIEEKYIKAIDLVEERRKLVKQLLNRDE